MASSASSLHARSPHTIPTWVLQAGLAGAVVVQLVSSLFMDPDGVGNMAYLVHQWSGLVAFGLVAAAWHAFGANAALVFQRSEGCSVACLAGILPLGNMWCHCAASRANASQDFGPWATALFRAVVTLWRCREQHRDDQTRRIV